MKTEGKVKEVAEAKFQAWKRFTCVRNINKPSGVGGIASKGEIGTR